MKVKTNLYNFTGKECEVTVHTGNEFSMYDYDWEIVKVNDEEVSGGWFTLSMVEADFNEVLFVNDGEMSMERMVKVAMIWIGNNI